MKKRTSIAPLVLTTLMLTSCGKSQSPDVYEVTERIAVPRCYMVNAPLSHCDVEDGEVKNCRCMSPQERTALAAAVRAEEGRFTACPDPAKPFPSCDTSVPPLARCGCVTEEERDQHTAYWVDHGWKKGFAKVPIQTTEKNQR